MPRLSSVLALLPFCLACTPVNTGDSGDSGGETDSTEHSDSADSSDGSDTSDSGDSADSGDSTDSGDPADSGDTADTSDSGETADSGDSGTPPADRDGDGYTATADGGTDCDDDDSAVYPGAVEICGDGRLNDCDGSVSDATRACLSGGVDDLSTIGVRLQGELDGGMATRVARVGDLDGDGRDDLMVGDPANPRAVNQGVVYLLTSPPTSDIVLSAASTTVRASGTFSLELGNAMSGGDVDGDGYADLVLGNTSAGDWATDGAAWGFVGPVSGALTLDDAELELTSTTTPLNHHDLVVEVLPDLDGDGTGGLGVGIAGAAGVVDAESVSKAGQIYLFEGLPGGALDADDADAVITGFTSDFGAGSGIMRVGDMDGDGFEDVAVSADWRLDDDEGIYPSAQFRFMTEPLSGALSFEDIGSRDFDCTASNGEVNKTRVPIAPAGDQDGDGYAEAIFGCQRWKPEQGFYTIIQGGTSISSELAEIDGEDAYADDLGVTVASGDWDADGQADLALGAMKADDGGSNSGVLYLLFGPVAGSVSVDTSGVPLLGGAGDYFGSHATGVGDQDGDGRDDLLVGAPYDEGTGAVWLITGWGT